MPQKVSTCREKVGSTGPLVLGRGYARVRVHEGERAATWGCLRASPKKSS